MSLFNLDHSSILPVQINISSTISLKASRQTAVSLPQSLCGVWRGCAGHHPGDGPGGCGTGTEAQCRRCTGRAQKAKNRKGETADLSQIRQIQNKVFTNQPNSWPACPRDNYGEYAADMWTQLVMNGDWSSRKVVVLFDAKPNSGGFGKQTLY